MVGSAQLNRRKRPNLLGETHDAELESLLPGVVIQSFDPGQDAA